MESLSSPYRCCLRLSFRLPGNIRPLAISSEPAPRFRYREGGPQPRALVDKACLPAQVWTLAWKQTMPPGQHGRMCPVGGLSSIQGLSCGNLAIRGRGGSRIGCQLVTWCSAPLKRGAGLPYFERACPRRRSCCAWAGQASGR